jgi:hypothetical protein
VPPPFPTPSSQDEVRAIVRKRREHEYSMAKRTPAESDYVRSLEYELAVEALRRQRKARLGLRRTTVSDHAGIRRIHFIFDRVCKRFRGRVAWWLQWLDFSLRTASGKAAGRILGRALQLHPHSSELWMQAAAFEFDRQHNMSAARALLQRGLRANGSSPSLWVGYFRMECLYILKVKGRRTLLGLLGGGAAAKAAEGAEASEDGGAALVSAAALGAVGGQQKGEGEEEEEDAGYEPDFAEGAAAAAADDEAAAKAKKKADAQETADLFAGLDMDGAGLGAGASSAALENADARAAFFAGAVPRLIYDQACRRSDLAKSAAARLQFLEAVDSFRDIPAAASAAASSSSAAAPAAAFPALAAHILADIASAFPDDPATWRALAGRPIRAVVDAAEVRGRAAARRRAALTMDVEGGAASASSSSSATGAADEEAPPADETLFVIDTRGAPGKKVAAAAASASAAPSSGNKMIEEEEDDTEEEEDDDEDEPTGLVFPAYRASTDAAAWAQALSSGAVDSYVVAALPIPEGVPFDDNAGSAAGSEAEEDGTVQPRSLLPPAPRGAVWSVRSAASPSSSAAAPPSAKPGKKRGREEAQGEGASSSSSSFALVCPDAVLPSALAPEEEQLLAAAEAGLKPVLESLSPALAIAPVASRPASLYAVAAEAVGRLAGLPLARTAGNAARVVAVLRAVVRICEDAAAKLPASAALPKAERRVAASLALTHVAALLRLGRAADAAEVAAAAGARLADQGTVAVAHARLAHILRLQGKAWGAPPAASAAAAKKEAPGSAAAAVPLPGGLTVPCAQLCPWQESPAAVPRPDAILDAALHAKRVSSHMQLPLWLGLVEARAAAAAGGVGGGAGKGGSKASPHAAALASALLAGLPPSHETAVRLHYVSVVLASSSSSSSWRLDDLTPALGPAASPAVHASVLEAAAAAALAGGAGKSGSEAAAQRQARVQEVRRVFDVSLAQHGGASADLWLLLLGFERRAGAAGKGGPKGDLASSAYDRACRTLPAALRLKFIEAATLRSVGGR